MNWTGGRLSRHSRNANGGGITGRQKQHFAKVRTAQQGVAQMSPVKWSVFNQITIASRNPSQPIVSRSRRDEPAENVPDKHLQYPKRAAERERPSTEHEIRSPTNAPQVEGRQMTRRTLAESTESINAKSVPKRDRDVDSPAEQDTMEKRRKILSRGDWVGVSFQKPLDLKYAPPEQVDQIGRRRKLSGSHRARYEQRHREILPPPMPRAIKKDSQDIKARNPNVRISIGGKELRIGVSSSSGLVKAPVQTIQHSAGRSSSDVMLLDCEEGGNQDPPASYPNLTRPDPMPMDSQARNLSASAYSPFQRTPSVIGTFKYPAPQHMSKKSVFPDSELAEDSQPKLPLIKSYTQNSAGTPDLSSKRTLSTSEIRDMYHNFRDQAMMEAPSVASDAQGFVDQEIQDPRQYRPAMNFEEKENRLDPRSASVSTSLLSFGDNAQNTRAPRHGLMETRVVSSLPVLEAESLVSRPSPLIQHPAPQSSRTSQLLRSDVSDARLSMAAQAGRAEPASQHVDHLGDDEMWKSWMLPENGSLDSADREVSHSENASLTPGISTSKARLENKLPSSPIYRDDDSQIPFSEQDSNAGIEIDDAHDTAQEDESAIQLHSELESYLHPQRIQASSPSVVQEQIEKSTMQPVPVMAPGAGNSKTSFDENSLWQKFVFTSESDGEESPTKPPVRPSISVWAAPEYSEDSSLLAHPSNETEESSLRSAGEQRPLVTASASEQEMNDRTSIHATQGTRAGFSPSIAETALTQVKDAYTTRATQGSYRSSPDKAGSPIFSPTPYQNNTNKMQQQSNHEPRRKIVFTKPKPFVGKKASGAKTSEKPVEIGRKRGNSGTQRDKAGRGEGGDDKDEDNYDFSSSDEAESIEDY